MLALALDLGTTTLAGRLLDADGTVRAETRLINPQAALGSDILRRLERSWRGEGGELQRLLADGIERLVATLLKQAGATAGELSAAAAAGNPGICHLLRRLPVDSLLFPPHRPLFPGGEGFDPAILGLTLPVPLYLFPLVSGYVGGDLVAFVFADEPHAPESFFLDIGTNGEMALYSGGHWLTTSVAAGPAFEAGEIGCGMPLQPGAVKGVQLDGDALVLTVEGGGRPRGLCGTGLVEAIAAALEGGLVDRSGTIVAPEEVPDNLVRYLVETPAGRGIRLYRDAVGELVLGQEDIRRFQLAKGAVRAGVERLLARAGVSAATIERVVVTGAFGFSLAPAALKRVAMLPENMVEKVSFVPGGALAGVSRLLLDPQGPEKVLSLARKLKSYPLSGTPTFEKAFLAALDF